MNKRFHYIYISHFILSGLIIYGMLLLGKMISSILPFSFPGSIIGLLILFLSLQTKIIKLEWLNPIGPIILTYMALFFIPPAVGVLRYQDIVLSNFWIIIFNSLVGLALIILVVGRLYQLMVK